MKRCNSPMDFPASVATPAPKHGSCVPRGIPANVMDSEGAGCTQQGQDFVLSMAPPQVLLLSCVNVFLSLHNRRKCKEKKKEY